MQKENMAKKNGTNKWGRSASNSGARPALQNNLGATFRTETNLGAARREKKISAQLAAKRLARRRRRPPTNKKTRRRPPHSREASLCRSGICEH
jgi:hypothetical protein